MKKFNNRKKIKINKETRSEYNFKEVSLTKMAKRQLFVTLFSILGVTIISLVVHMQSLHQYQSQRIIML